MQAVFRIERVWDYFTIKDVLNLSVCSRVTASLVINSKSLQLLISRFEGVGKIGNFTLKFDSALSTGLFRRVLNRIKSGTDAIISIDNNSGRVVLDIGGAFRDNNAILATNVTVEPCEEDPPLDSGAFEISKFLEVSSFDEYDDFNPRHPLPRDNVHRRGDSYFNSDVEQAASEALAMGGLTHVDLTAIATKALEKSDTEVKNNPISVKNRFLAAKASKLSQIMATQNAARACLRGDSDDEES
jgi:hypothetical protein